MTRVPLSSEMLGRACERSPLHECSTNVRFAQRESVPKRGTTFCGDMTPMRHRMRHLKNDRETQ